MSAEGKYVNLIIDISHEKLDRTFQYKIPEHLLGKIQIGMVVQVPFGKGEKLRKGYVMEVTNRALVEEERMKWVEGIASHSPIVEERFIQLAAWMRERYGSTMAAALKVVLPVKKAIKPKEKKEIHLLFSVEEAKEKLFYFKKKKQTARARLLEALIEEKVLSYERATAQLKVSSQVIQALCEMGCMKVYTEQIYRNPVKGWDYVEKEKTLSPEQEVIVKGFVEDDRKEIRRVYVIHGITGSGKTEVYMEMIRHIVKTGRQAIVLIPEISLTYQTAMRFYGKFGDRVSIVNSKLSKGEKYDQFERARRGEIDVMIGPRSALFTPFSNLGLIIIDEEHEGTYKSEPLPKYHAREVGVYLSKLWGASLVLGSATPSLEAYYQTQIGNYKLYELKNRATKGSLPFVHVVDLREELRKGNRSIFSKKLKELIENRLNNKEQIMLFLNRRGYAGFLSCRSCGYVIKCPHCDVSLSAHKNGQLLCHYCGYCMAKLPLCPKCGSKYIGGMRLGTQKVEEILKKEYPQARILRMDTDTTGEKEGYEKILSLFANKEADILIGTQMIVKGHDFPLVTLVGVLAADMSLGVGDYRASERTFQLLTQAAGRAGRGEKPGEVVIQTYNPEHYSIVAASKQDYKAFYSQEMEYRKLLGYPPAAHLMAALIESLDKSVGEAWGKELTKYIFKEAKERRVSIIGPTEAFVSKINDIYRQVFYLKSWDEKELIFLRDRMEQYIEGRGGGKIRVQFDFDPMNSY